MSDPLKKTIYIKIKEIDSNTISPPKNLTLHLFQLKSIFDPVGLT